MRWFVKEPKDGDKRWKTFFAIMPFKWRSQYRWLEFVTIEQEYSYYRGWVTTKCSD